MSLRDAIYEPRLAPPPSKWESKTPIQDSIRRQEMMKQEKIPIIVTPQPKLRKAEKIEKPETKQGLLDRFISLFK